MQSIQSTRWGLGSRRGAHQSRQPAGISARARANPPQPARISGWATTPDKSLGPSGADEWRQSLATHGCPVDPREANRTDGLPRRRWIDMSCAGGNLAAIA